MRTIVSPITYGRLGNFLFQAACAIAYAWDHNLDFSLPAVSKRPAHYPVYLQHLVNPDWDPSLPCVTLKELGMRYAPLPWKEEWRGSRNILLDGYWQSEKYFAHHRERLLRVFALPWSHHAGTVSVHVRRGDYLRYKNKFLSPTAKWVEQAMALFPGACFVFFSDDIPWCKATFGEGKDRFYSCNPKELEDLIGISCCEHHICSASTFSWWGAWLNQHPKKQVIMPKDWFHPDCKGLDTSDIVPANWERV